ncbi:MAG: N-acetyl-alpha-D-glucosaminyl L-malate synthase BshA, partial [Anaerolineae bacterium]|nr:N-acetyl-alpha-D-glucosaminyl L-malate synthase BshA [Anaerolineae bacterium]
TTLHGTDVTLVGNNPSFKPVTEMAINASDAVTAVSHYLKDATYQEFTVEKEIDVIYNFIDPVRHNRPIPPCIGPKQREQQVTLMHISNFRPVKRVLDVVKVFALVAAELDARLVLIGDGPDQSKAMQAAQDLGVLDRVNFVGVVDQVAPYLQAADLFLLPSETESFGLVALEAMASGVPVVASDVGGIPEVVKHGETGYLAPLGDVDKMADYAIKLLSDCTVQKRFAETARQHAIQNFDYHNIVPQYEAIYKRVLD